MNALLQQVVDDLQRGYGGDPWHGPSLLGILEGIDHVVASAAPSSGAHTIAELVLHIASWKEIVAERLISTTSVDVSRERDWPQAHSTTLADWQAALQRLDAAQRELIRSILEFDPARLSGTVPGKQHSFATELTGVAQHDAYHGGQIALLKRANQSRPTA